MTFESKSVCQVVENRQEQFDPNAEKKAREMDICKDLIKLTVTSKTNDRKAKQRIGPAGRYQAATKLHIDMTTTDRE